MRNIIFGFILCIMSIACFAQENDNNAIHDNMEEKQKPFVLYNFVSGKREEIKNPIQLVEEDAVQYIPQLESAQSIFKQNIGQGYTPLESVFYTYFELLDYKFEPIKPLSSGQKK